MVARCHYVEGEKLRFPFSIRHGPSTDQSPPGFKIWYSSWPLPCPQPALSLSYEAVTSAVISSTTFFTSWLGKRGMKSRDFTVLLPFARALILSSGLLKHPIVTQQYFLERPNKRVNVKIIRNAWRTSVLYFQSSPNWVLALHPANCACAPKEKVLIVARVVHTEWTYSPRSCQSSGQQCHWERHPSLSNSKKETDLSFGQSRLQDLHWPWNNNLLETILAEWSLCLITRRVWTSNFSSNWKLGRGTIDHQ